MLFVPRAIHQFHGGSALGDAITTGLLYTRDLLRSLGYASEIYCEDIPPELAGEIRPIPTFPDSADTVLLLHFSWAIRFSDWVRRLTCRKAIVYHNITPVEFFDPTQAFEETSRQARRQLAALRPAITAGYADSTFNARELKTLGYHPVQTLPILFDPARWRTAPYDAQVTQSLVEDEAFKILFVGRIIANKCQEDLLRVVARLRSMMARPVRLILAGGLGAGPEYHDRLIALQDELCLQECVEFTGKISDSELLALYRGADVFLCLSEHEGFCVPLIEAMEFDLPVVAYAICAIPETVGDGGILLDDKEPGAVAATLKVLAEEPELRRRLVMAGRRNVLRFSRAETLRRLATFLRTSLDIDVVIPAAPPAFERPPQWRIDGPFDSSYSLALVNRSLAQALDAQQVDVGLYSTEGPGDFYPAKTFLAAEPKVAAIWRHGNSMERPLAVIRNLYPPRVSDISAPTRILGGWGWEESGIPDEWVGHFNRNLNLITAVSGFVAKVLSDNGVRVPVAIVGNGGDHLRDVVAVMPSRSLGKGSFRFLHVSSGFPRKGADVLLEAWRQTFAASDDVTLIIKTFPNQHNNLKEQIAVLSNNGCQHAEIILIDDDLSAAELVGLYRSCNALVMPSRGEGFGLPAAEAMLCGLPVIATRHGGLLEFCSEQTAWLVDYRFAYANTHFGLFVSVWAEPVVEDLGRALREVAAASVDERQSRTQAARALIEQAFTWSAVARRTQEAVARLDDRSALLPLPRVAWITSWNVRCGIASYARQLASELPLGVLQVFASRSGERLQPDEPFVQRCWNQGWDDRLDGLYQAILGSGATVAVFQFNFGFFELYAFGQLLDRLKDVGVSCNVFLHSTSDVNRPGVNISLGQIRDSLARLARLFVHSVCDLNRLKAIGLTENVTLFPHGISRQEETDPAVTRRELGLTTKRVLACFGYLLPGKGLLNLLQAFLQLRQRHPRLHLLMINAIYPGPESQQEADRCRCLIESHSAATSVTLITDYLSEVRAHALLQTADLVVFPYEATQESSSAAVRFGLAARRPVACTPLSIFDDVGKAVHRLPGTTTEDLARGIGDIISDPKKLESLLDLQDALLSEHSWSRVSTRMWNILRAPPIIDLVPR